MILKYLTITFPLTVKEILSIEIFQKYHSHAIAKIGVLLQDGQNIHDIYALNEKTNVALKYKQKNIFSGVLLGININMQQGVCKLEMTVKSCTALLDIRKRKRSFQNEEYQSIFQQIITKYDGDIIDTASKGKNKNNIIIQYDETDWQFLLRVASQINAAVIPDVLSNKPKIYIGLPQGEQHQLSPYHYKITKQISDSEQVEIETEQNFELGDTILFQNTPFVIAQKKMYLKHACIRCRYTICRKESVAVETFYNTALQGAGIQAKVLDVKQDRLKLHLNIDQTQEKSKCHWFSYQTSYAAEGQTGFYTMPQIGDTVILYSPQKEESKCYVIASKRIEKNNSIKDSSVKRFATTNHKEMALSKNSIDIVSEKCAVNMEDTKGITLIGNAGIKINTDSILKMEAEKVTMKADDRIVAITPKANLIIDEIMHFKA